MSYYTHDPYWTERQMGARCPYGARLSVQEQMGVDPISKLAAAVEKLAEAVAKDKA